MLKKGGFLVALFLFLPFSFRSGSLRYCLAMVKQQHEQLFSGATP